MISRTIIAIIMINAVFSKIGDRAFFCNFPEFFDTTVRPA